MTAASDARAAECFGWMVPHLLKIVCVLMTMGVMYVACWGFCVLFGGYFFCACFYRKRLR